MADPRSTTIDRIGTNPNRPLTFKIDGTDIVYSAPVANASAGVGRAVMLSGNGVVRLTGAGSRVLGKLMNVEPDGACLVMTAGVVDLPKGDNAIAVNDKIVGDTLSAARGYVRSSVAATLADVAQADHCVLDVS